MNDILLPWPHIFKSLGELARCGSKKVREMKDIVADEKGHKILKGRTMWVSFVFTAHITYIRCSYM